MANEVRVAAHSQITRHEFIRVVTVKVTGRDTRVVAQVTFLDELGSVVNERDVARHAPRGVPDNTAADAKPGHVVVV